MTVGEFHHAAGRALAGGHGHADHPVEDAAELAETLAAAAMLLTALGKQLCDVAGAGARYQSWGSALAEVTDAVAHTPQLMPGDPARAQHPLARTYLAAAAAVGLERDLLAANRQRLQPEVRLWLTRETLARISGVVDSLGRFAEPARALHPATAEAVFLFTANATRATRHAAAALPAADPGATTQILPAGTRLEQSRATIAHLPEPLRPAFSRLLVEARGFNPVLPPARGSLRGYSLVTAAGAVTAAAFLEQAGGSEVGQLAGHWHAAAEPWRELDRVLPHVATLGRPDSALAAAARDAVATLDRLRQLPAPAREEHRDRLLRGAAALGAAVAELAAHQHRLVDRLAAAGDLYHPISRHSPEGAAAWERRIGPSQWVPTPPGQAADLTTAYAEGAALTAAAAGRTAAHARAAAGPAPQKAGVSLVTLEQLARAHTRNAAPTSAAPALPAAGIRP